MMKKFTVLFVFTILIASCSKERFSAKGPTDVRVRNLSDQVFDNVTIATDDENGEQNLGNIESGSVSSYSRVEIAYPKAEITAMIGGIQYSTGKPDYTYETYIGTDMITYEVFISDAAAHKLQISNVIRDAPITDL